MVFLDDVRIYNRMLTAAEIKALAAGHPMDTKGNHHAAGYDGTSTATFILGDGIFDAAAQTINIAGDWTKSAGTFTYGTSTVAFDDDNVDNTISGSTTFYNLDISTATKKTVTFESGSTTGVAASGTMTLTGASGQLLTLDPGTASTTWLLDFDGATQNVSYVDVSYSDATPSAVNINATDGTNVDGTNNTKWDFIPDTTVALTGTVTNDTEADIAGGRINHYTITDQRHLGGRRGDL